MNYRRLGGIRGVSHGILEGEVGPGRLVGLISEKERSDLITDDKGRSPMIVSDWIVSNDDTVWHHPPYGNETNIFGIFGRPLATKHQGAINYIWQSPPEIMQTLSSQGADPQSVHLQIGNKCCAYGVHTVTMHESVPCQALLEWEEVLNSTVLSAQASYLNRSVASNHARAMPTSARLRAAILPPT